MSLADELQARFEHALATRTPEINATMDAQIDELRRTGAVRDAPRPGDAAPAFTLPDTHGATVESGALLAGGPVVLAFYRGGWCPYCNIQLRAYERMLPELGALGATLVAVSPQLPDGSLSTVEKNALTFPVLSDVGNHVARAYGLVFTVPEAVQRFYLDDKGVDLAAINGDAAWELPVPGCFVIGADGRVLLADADPDYTRRLEPAAILEALR
ncbi:MAG TPA: peroxiredoxin-like family protein [Baekduia sp.]|jgi:peroxiredoxin